MTARRPNSITRTGPFATRRRLADTDDGLAADTADSFMGTRESETPTPAIFYHAAARFRSEIQTKTPSVSKFFDGSHRFISTTANPRSI